MENYKKDIERAIKFLTEHGYTVSLNLNHLIDKWVVFKQEGMEDLLHGKIIAVNNNVFTIRCKNGERRFCDYENIFYFFNTKEECYKIK